MTPGPMLEIDWSIVLTALIGAAGGAVVALIGARERRHETAKTLLAQQDRERRDRAAQQEAATQTLIDQIQEERDAYAQQLREERAAGDARLDKMWADKAASRQHVAQLRAHIYRGDPPPPPEPPVGYIE